MRRPGRTAAASAAAASLLLAALTFALGPASAAELGERPTITGDPIVGQTLASSSAGDSALYTWQRCDPAAGVCADGPKDDPAWSDIPGAHGKGARTYTLSGSDLGRFVRVLAKDTSLGTQFAPSLPAGPVRPAAAQETAEPPLVPEHGVRLVGRPAEGFVRFKPRGQRGYTTLTETTSIPVNSLVDTRRGTIVLTAATGEFGSQTPDQSVEFYDGLFKIKQSPATNSIAVAKLAGKLACGKGSEIARSKARRSSGPVATASAPRKRRLWGRGSGKYGTAGAGGTGSVRGTTWLTKDNCKGTKFKVTDGIGITVDDGDKEIELGPGDSYFAKR